MIVVVVSSAFENGFSSLGISGGFSDNLNFNEHVSFAGNQFVRRILDICVERSSDEEDSEY